MYIFIKYIFDFMKERKHPIIKHSNFISYTLLLLGMKKSTNTLDQFTVFLLHLSET